MASTIKKGTETEFCARLSIILQATADLNDMLSEPERLYSSLLEHLGQAVPFSTGSLQVMEDDAARIIAFRGPLDPAVVMGLRFRMDPLFPNYRVVMAREPVAFGDIRVAYPHFFTRQEEFSSGNIRSWLGVPMIASGMVIGMFALDRNVVDPFSEDDIRIVQGFANHAAVAIRNARTMRDLKDAVKAKDTLLREIHHRVKNNLQLVSSLIDIHSRGISDQSARDGMEELQIRIRSISSIHELLYEHADATSVDLEVYLRVLAHETVESLIKNDIKASLVLELKPVKVDPSTAVPLGLIVSELIINALKYAFPGTASGTIHIELAIDGKNAQLTVSDNGIGMDPAAARKGSFGLTLVQGLATQINGTATLESRPGHTAWTIVFPAG